MEGDGLIFEDPKHPETTKQLSFISCDISSNTDLVRTAHCAVSKMQQNSYIYGTECQHRRQLNTLTSNPPKMSETTHFTENRPFT